MFSSDDAPSKRSKSRNSNLSIMNGTGCNRGVTGTFVSLLDNPSPVDGNFKRERHPNDEVLCDEELPVLHRKDNEHVLGRDVGDIPD